MGKGLVLYGHRGASAELPENTIAAFRRALDRGATALEMDVHMTLDGHVVVAHDAGGRRMAGVPRDIRLSSLRDVQSWDVGYGFQDAHGERPFLGQGFHIPLLEEVLEEFPGVPLNIDIKQADPSMTRPLLELIRRHGAEGRVLLASFFDDVLREVRALGYRGPMALGRHDIERLLCSPARLIEMGLVRTHGTSVQVPVRHGPLRFATQSFVDKCHRLGLRVDFWTINDEETARLLVDLGADGIMSDDPARVAKVLPLSSSPTRHPSPVAQRQGGKAAR